VPNTCFKGISSFGAMQERAYLLAGLLGLFAKKLSNAS